MLSKTRGIVLHLIPYNDRYSIIYMYTEAFGRVSYLVPRSKGKRSAIPKGLFMPLSVLDMEVDHQPKRDLQRLKEVKLFSPFSAVSTHPVKNVIALFMAEVLYRVVREQEPDARLFHFLCQTVSLLEDLEEGIANFHLVFLLNLLHYLGVFPHIDTYRDGCWFDMLSGEFVDSPPLHSHRLTPDESVVFVRLLRISYENMAVYSFSRQGRVEVIRRILEYYRLHLPEFPEIKSLAVLQSLFD